MNSTRVRITILIFFILATGCRYHAPPVQVAGAGTPATEFADVPVEAPEAVLLPAYDSASSLYKGLHQAASTLKFYELMHQQPVWVHQGRNSVLADSMTAFIQGIRYYGLLPQHYHAPELATGDDSAPEDNANILRREVLLTDAFLSIAKDLKSGRLPQQEPGGDSLHRALLDEALRSGALRSALESLEPRLSAYRLLKGGLRVLIDTIAPMERALLMAGVTGDTLASHQIARTIEINLERFRQEKALLHERHIFVNIPSFMAYVYDEDSLILESRVIIGKPDHPTPVLSSTIQCFITYPYWHVPRKISVEELLPMIQKDPGYLARNNFDVLDRKGQLLNPDSLHWLEFDQDNFPVSLRQREGTDNSLGIIKFVFDNPYAVYLHDTNARRLFKNRMRALSHGCIRMEKAIDFAHYLVTGDVRLKSPRIEKILLEKMRHNIELQRPISIHVRYVTAEVRGDMLMLYKDLYEKDRILIRDLYETGGAGVGVGGL